MDKTIKCVVLYFVCSIIVEITAQSEKPSNCTTPVNEPGLCIPLKNCSILFNRILIEGQNLTRISRRHLSRSQCGYNDGQPLVCCPDLKSRSGDDILPRGDDCGINPMNRYVRESKSELDTFPWMALLEYTKGNDTKGFHCVGALIGKRYVLTAAHCLSGKDIPSTWNLTGVRLGEYNLETDPDCEEFREFRDCSDLVIDVEISETHIHELYDPQSKNQVNDIALLRLQTEVVETDFVKTICLPRSNNFKNIIYDNVILEDAGWNRETIKASVKRTGYIDTINSTQCNKVYNGVGIYVDENQFCGISRPLPYSYKSCQGLPGTPVMEISKDDHYGHWYLAGIETFGPLTCRQDVWPNVYTRISSYIDWIDSKVYA